MSAKLQPGDLVSLNEAAAILGVSRLTARRYIEKGILPASKPLGVWRIRRSDLENLLGGAA